MQNHKNWNQFQCIHPQISSVCLNNNMRHPTHIQAEVFSCYTYYHDFLIAAQTGSGKTLAFAAPIISEMQYLKENLGMDSFPRKILALILTPTRQLAQQIYGNVSLAISAINNNIPLQKQLTVSCIIGGISKQKQLRILRQHEPQIIIGTPGRLHELLDDDVLQFSNLKYLVIDEADRMIQMGHFKEIDQILEKIFVPKKKQTYEKDFQEINEQLLKNAAQEEFFIKENGKKRKLNFSITSIPTDQIFQLPADLFQISNPTIIVPVKEKKKKQKEEIKQKPKNQLSPEHQYYLTKLKRRIFFVSATLTRQFKGTKYFFKKTRTEQQWAEKRQERKKNRKDKEKKDIHGNKNKNQGEQKDQSIQQMIPKLKALLSRAHFSQKPKIIDLSSVIFLPEKLVQRACYTEGQQQRITLLVSYLKQLPKGAKTIIFANTIKFCKRIQYFLQAFGMLVVNLHSGMQQKQRLKKLEKFKQSTLYNILIATDVAARGLDFHITHVVQVGVAINGDTYVHRAGRTARANREGESFILIDKKQANRWIEISENISEASPNRKLEKYLPRQQFVNDIRDKVEKFEWIRRNTQKDLSQKLKKHDYEDADNVGVMVQEEGTRKKYDLDREQEQMVRQEVKKRVNIIRSQHKTEEQQKEQNRWKKNKLVLSLEEIKKYL